MAEFHGSLFHEGHIFYFFRSIPDIDGGILSPCQCVSLDGKLYVLGAMKDHCRRNRLGSEKVYVLDLAGEIKWRQCASMQKPRLDFGCGVIDGKIYVLGGLSLNEPVRISEVYYPKVDAWSPIMPMISLRWAHHVAAMGEELCVYGGEFYASSNRTGEQKVDFDHTENASFFEIYHPVKNEWRKVYHLERNHMEIRFVAQGKLYSMTRLDIYVHDFEKGSWTLLHSSSFGALGPGGSVVLMPDAVVAVLPVNDELLAIVDWYRRDNRTSGRSLLQSGGFCSENRRVAWDKVNSFSIGRCPFMYPVQL